MSCTTPQATGAPQNAPPTPNANIRVQPQRACRKRTYDAILPRERYATKAHQGACSKCAVCSESFNAHDVTKHPLKESMESLNAYLMMREFVTAPLQEGVCLCYATTCGYYAWKRRFQPSGANSGLPTADPEEARLLGRVPTAPWDSKSYNNDPNMSKHRRLTHLSVVQGLQAEIEFEKGSIILDCCGGSNDAIAVGFRSAGCSVLTNDIVHCRVADHHMDTTSSTFVKYFSENVVDWIVSSPPYDSHQSLSSRALIPRKGVCMKVLLSFLEPCDSRKGWLLAHPISKCIIIQRMKYGSAPYNNYTECWLVWDKLHTYKQQIVWSLTKS